MDNPPVTALADRVDEFLRAPVAATTFLLAAHHRLDPELLSDPATITALAAIAVDHLNPWTGEAPTRRAAALDAAADLRGLVTAVLTDPRNTWWSAPLDRSAQLLLTARNDPPRDPHHLPTPTAPAHPWETYAQRPLHHTTTSTELPVPPTNPIRSAAHAALTHGTGDWSPTYPIHQTRLQTTPQARILEIDSAPDWHHLALHHTTPTTYPGPDPHLLTTAAIDHGPSPTWTSVAAHHDAVHLTLAGLLTALYSPITTNGTTTTLWAWPWESTHWLRSAFTTATPLPHLPEPPHPAPHLTT